MPKKAGRKLKRYAHRTQAQLKLDQGERLRILPFYRMASELEQLAIEQANTRSAHYAGYRVGAAGIALLSDGSYAVVVGANKKSAPGERQESDHCAEEALERAAYALGGEVIGQVVTSPRKIDDATGFDLKVNISCWYCRRRYEQIICEPARRQGHSARPNTLLRFVDLNDPRHRIDLTVSDVVALCRRKDDDKKRGG